MAEAGAETAHSAQLTTKQSNRIQSRSRTQSRWLRGARKLLRSVSKGFARYEELLFLKITVLDLLESPVAASSAAVLADINTFLQSSRYQVEIQMLREWDWPRRIQRRPNGANESCGNWISSLIITWAEEIAKQTGYQFEALREYRLHIKGDSRTNGVISTLTMVAKKDIHQQPLLSLIRRNVAIEKGLTSVELYALLAAAASTYLAQPHVKDTLIYRIEIFSIYSYWLQRITARIPALYIRSMLQGRQQLVENMEISRGPCLDFHENDGHGQIVQRIFECCELQAVSSQMTPAIAPSTAFDSKQMGIAKDIEK